MFLTLKRVQHTEDVVGWDGHISITEESNAPRQTKESKQTQDHHQLILERGFLDITHTHVSCLKNFADDHDEDSGCETED